MYEYLEVASREKGLAQATAQVACPAHKGGDPWWKEDARWPVREVHVLNSRDPALGLVVEVSTRSGTYCGTSWQDFREPGLTFSCISIF